MSDAVGRPVALGFDNPVDALVYPEARDLAPRLTTGGGRDYTPPSLPGPVKAALRSLAPAVAVGASRFLVDGTEASLQLYQTAKPALKLALRVQSPAATLGKTIAFFARGTALAMLGCGIPLAGQYWVFRQMDTKGPAIPSCMTAALSGALTSPAVHVWQMATFMRPSLNGSYLNVVFDCFKTTAQGQSKFVPFHYTLARQTLATTALFSWQKSDSTVWQAQLGEKFLMGMAFAQLNDYLHTSRGRTSEFTRLAFGTLRWTLLQTVFQETNKLIKS